MHRAFSALAAAIVVSGGVASADERDDALWLTRFTQTSERMFALAVEKRDILALETNAVLFDIAIEQAGLSSESQFSGCWRAAVALQGLIGHLLTFTGEARTVLSERVFTAYSSAMPECEQLVGEPAERYLSGEAVTSFPAPAISELSLIAQ